MAHLAQSIIKLADTGPASIHADSGAFNQSCAFGTIRQGQPEGGEGREKSMMIDRSADATRFHDSSSRKSWETILPLTFVPFFRDVLA